MLIYLFIHSFLVLRSWYFPAKSQGRTSVAASSSILFPLKEHLQASVTDGFISLTVTSRQRGPARPQQPEL